MPPRVRYPKDVAIVEIQRNPYFDIKNLEILAKWCPHCTITGAYACGLNKPDPSAKELMAACAGERIVVPYPGSMIIIHSDDFTEQEFNAFCRKIVHMQACMPALRIVENFNLIEVILSPSLQIPEGVILLEVRDNPRLPITVLEMLLKLCPGCRISFDAGPIT
ncbi:unnamed protein product [Cylicostephanus goldi]|uniref:Uncharacterized protein n=1 Tax=Cylicostephanus goldi TaxID=71465 RepID=A0A3P7QFW9_CYLGO|nr:unnamed protein product [Cylicostephanus goldi]